MDPNCSGQHCHQKQRLSHYSSERQPRSSGVLFAATLEGVFPENRLSISHLLPGSQRWGLFVCFSMTNSAPAATLSKRQSFPGASRGAELHPLQLQRLHPFFGAVTPWQWHAAPHCSAIPPVPVPVPALARVPLLCLLYHPACAVI